MIEVNETRLKVHLNCRIFSIGGDRSTTAINEPPRQIMEELLQVPLHSARVCAFELLRSRQPANFVNPRKYIVWCQFTQQGANPLRRGFHDRWNPAELNRLSWHVRSQHLILKYSCIYSQLEHAIFAAKAGNAK
ncbi:hypothetical protein XU18_2440 [Perkinsela sp. CCAP 1560/4]|nr:hypothetical protein XU18_2440 [Perkinsela sp. CCAP 1560/4]|eukprot:KNH06767.1 hypothetical protein XU18_2440 [Perkinsela sp. CCAP 1560/4]